MKSNLEKMRANFNSLLSFAISLLPAGDYNFVVTTDEDCVELAEITSDTSKYRGKQVVSLIGELSTDNGVVVGNKLACVDTAVLMTVKPGDRYRVTVSHKLRTDGTKGQITTFTPLSVYEASKELPKELATKP